MYQLRRLRAVSVFLAVLAAFLLASCTPPGGPTEPPPGGDTTAPTATIQSVTTDPTDASPIDVTITFSEAVTGFDAADLTITNASAANFTAVDAATYKLDLTPDAPEVTVTLDIKAGVCSDAAGNPNSALGSAFCRTCTQRPTVVIASSISSAATNASQIPITITFSKKVEDFISAEVTLTNCAMSGFTTSDNTVWTASLSPSAQGEVSATVAEGVCYKTGSPTVTNVASSTFSRTYDSIAPTVGLSSTEPDPTNTTIQLTITFSEPVDPATFVAADITVSNGGSANTPQSLDNVTFTADVTPGGQGSVSISLAAGACKDPAGNDSMQAPTPITRVYDTVRPGATITSTAPTYTAVSPIPFTITFTEQLPAGQFIMGDIIAPVGAAMGSFTTTDNTVFTVNLTPLQQGSFTLNLAAGVCQDAAGNTNTASSLTRTYDTVSPGVTISSTTTSTTNANPIPVSFTFSEQLAAGTFTLGDITVGGGTAGNLQGSNDTVFTADVTPSALGPVTVDVAAGACTDRAGNTNTVAATLTRTYDATNAPGSLDTGFATGTGSNQWLQTVAVQSDGKILIGGYMSSYDGTPRGFVARLNDTGSLDTGFLATGAGANGLVYAIVPQSDGTVYIGGSFLAYNGTQRGNFARLNANGSLDTSFGGMYGASSAVNAALLQSDGKVIVGGQFTTYISTTRGYVARLNTNGSVDTSFAAGAGANNYVQAMALQSDGKVLIAGDFTTYDSTGRNRIARLNTDGTLDTGFDPGLGANDRVQSIAVQGDGRILISGAFTTYNGSAYAHVVRLNADGSLDTGFGPVNTQTVGTVYSVAVQGDGKILIGGYFQQVYGTWRYHLARLNANGTLDTGFLSGGNGAGDTSGGTVYCIAIQADGKIVIVGDFTKYTGTARGRIARVWN